MRVTHNLTWENKPFSIYTSFLVIVFNGLLSSRKELSVIKGGKNSNCKKFGEDFAVGIILIGIQIQCMVTLPLEIAEDSRSSILSLPYQLCNGQPPHSLYPPSTMSRHYGRMI